MTRNARLSPEKKLVVDARAAIETCAISNARLAARRLTQFLIDRMKTSALSVAQFGLMAQIAASDDSLGALARAAGLDPSTLSRNLQVLEREGLVEMAADEADSRRRAVWLTEEGARRLESALKEWRKAHAELTALIDVDAVRAIAKATERLTEG
jgi:DNA-binding MarR family transcriptional regulator